MALMSSLPPADLAQTPPNSPDLPVTRPNSPKLTRVLQRAIEGLETKAQDEAAIQLARLYAGQIDEDPGSLSKLGPLLLSVLESLGMTPKGRAAVLGKGGAQDAHPKRAVLDELRQRRTARQHTS